MQYELDHKPGDVNTIRVTTHCDRATLEQWLRTHTVDVDRYPVPTTLTIEDGKVTFEQYVFDDEGKPIIDGNDARRVIITVDQCAPWPLDLDNG
jgi:hypothetical protein